jgi:hypothetical protein
MTSTGPLQWWEKQKYAQWYVGAPRIVVGGSTELLDEEGEVLLGLLFGGNSRTSDTSTYRQGTIYRTSTVLLSSSSTTSFSGTPRTPSPRLSTAITTRTCCPQFYCRTRLRLLDTNPHCPHFPAIVELHQQNHPRRHPDHPNQFVLPLSASIGIVAANIVGLCHVLCICCYPRRARMVWWSGASRVYDFVTCTRPPPTVLTDCCRRLVLTILTRRRVNPTSLESLIPTAVLAMTLWIDLAPTFVDKGYPGELQKNSTFLTSKASILTL